MSLLTKPGMVEAKRTARCSGTGSLAAGPLPALAAIRRAAAVGRTTATVSAGGPGGDGVDGSGDRGQSGLTCPGIPQLIGVGGHLRSGVEIGGGEVVAHGDGQPEEEQTQEQCGIAVVPIRQEGQHLIH